MIERKFILERLKEYKIQTNIDNAIKGAGHAFTEIEKTPLGDKIIIHASKPGIIVGRRGSTIRDMTQTLGKQFKLDNPQIEIEEVQNPFINARIVAEKIALALERYGSSRFKKIGYSMLENVINNGALGVEILMSGKIPGARAKTWRFYMGYMKKSGSVAQSGVDFAIKTAELKSGTLGIQVRILPKSVKLPDEVIIKGLEEKSEKKKQEMAKIFAKTNLDEEETETAAELDNEEEILEKVEEPSLELLEEDKVSANFEESKQSKTQTGKDVEKKSPKKKVKKTSRKTQKSKDSNTKK